MFKEFKEFAMKGPVIDLAVGMIIGVAFTSIVKSLVDDIITPALAPLLSDVDFSALVWKGMNIGLFVNAVIAFIITAFVIFMIVRSINKLKKPEEKEEEEEKGPTEIDLLTEIRDSLRKHS